MALFVSLFVCFDCLFVSLFVGLFALGTACSVGYAIVLFCSLLVGSLYLMLCLLFVTFFVRFLFVSCCLFIASLFVGVLALLLHCLLVVR